MTAKYNPDTGGATEDEKLIAEWTEQPFTGFETRRYTVEHRLIASTYPGVGADLRHEVRCPDKRIEEWETAEVYEIREHGVTRVQSDDRWWTA